jgi:prepilin-type N-terminal cleavage/methylation domain-containing protein
MVMGRRGFTLIELVIIILIVVILAAVAIPKFVNLASNANVAQEAYIADTLHEALSNYHLENLGTTVYTGNPFDILATAPPNREATALPLPAPDGRTWIFYRWGLGAPSPPAPGGGGWYIVCPHYVAGSKGTQWLYSYVTAVSPPTWGFRKETDFGH